MAAHQLTLCQKYEDIEGLILLWGSSLPMQLNLSFIVLLTSRQSPPSNSPALVSHLLPFIIIGRPPYSKEGQCLANSPTGISVGELSKHTHRIALTKSGYPNNEPQSILFLPGNTNQGINGTFSDRKVSGTYEDNQSGYYVDSEFIEATGNNQYHNNISPCVSSYIWRRTA